MRFEEGEVVFVFAKLWSGGGALCFVLLVCQASEAQRVVYRSGLPDFGLATFDRSGKPVIMMNASLCRTRPDLCEFVRAHEVAHHRLGHLQRNMSVRQAEYEADRWAATHSSPRAVRAAQQFFGSGYGGTIRNGSSQQRLAVVSQASAKRKRTVRVYRAPVSNKRKSTSRTVRVVRTRPASSR